MKTLAKSKVKMYWRSKLYEYLRKPILVQGIVVRKTRNLEFVVSDWNDYWGALEVSKESKTALDLLHNHWQDFIKSGFHSNFMLNYSSSFFNLLNHALKKRDSRLLARLISFESFYVLNEGETMPYVGMTTNFRHPLFVFLSHKGFRKDDKQDTHILPIMTLIHQERAFQFYALSKDKLGRGNNHNLIIFLSTYPKDRSVCFNALQPLVGILHHEWGEFINKRASRIAQKVIIPLLVNFPEFKENSNNLLKVLDVGSRVGIVLSNVVRYLVSGMDNPPKIQARLLDKIAMDPKVQFGSDNIKWHTSSIEYIKDDFKNWFDQFNEPYSNQYHITFIYRLLHTMSNFCIVPEESTADEDGRVEVSKYFEGQYIISDGHGSNQQENGNWAYKPKRIFNLNSLETASGRSIIEKCVRMSIWTIIEDLDCDPQSLIEHLNKYNLYKDIYVFDLSGALKLRTNYIYCICSSKSHAPTIGKLIWPS